jgi:hypothetical protein
MFNHTDSLPSQALNVLKGELQTITGTVEGAHLRWLETVLKAARTDDSIKYIFVQGHLPVLHPVRARHSSIMYFDGGAESPFWQLLRKYKVDVYFSGEVHSDTLIKDPESSLVQVTTRAGITRSMVTAVQVTTDGLRITQYGQNPDGSLVATGSYQRTEDSTEETFSGVLTPLDTQSPVLEYDFDRIVANQIPNSGSFGTYYNLTCASCDLTTAQEDSRVLTGGVAYIADGYASPTFLRSMPTTISFRFRSEDQGRSVIFSATDARLYKGFAVFLDNGMLDLQYFYNSARISFDGNLADGNWHQVTFRHARDDAFLDLRTTVDGKLYQLFELPKNTDPSWRDMVLTWRRGLDSPPNHALSIGGHFSKPNQETVFEFQGEIDYFKLWGRELTDQEIEKLRQSR